MNITLYGFKICPFVERIQLLLSLAGITYQWKYIDIRNKPAWYFDVTPTGKVPALEVDGFVLFESLVIMNFLDSISKCMLYPNDLREKAWNASWMAWSDGLIFDAYYMTMASTKDMFHEHESVVHTKLKLLENQIQAGATYFNGDNLNMIDLAFLPLLKRFDSYQKRYDFDIIHHYPRIQKWAEHLLQHTVASEVYNESFESNLDELLDLKDSYLNVMKSGGRE